MSPVLWSRWLQERLVRCGAGSARRRPGVVGTGFRRGAEHKAGPLVLVDIPIGLPRSSRRACDVAAAAALGPRRSSVFAVPLRDAVYAPTYEEGNRIQRAHGVPGFSRQSWALVQRIREVDKALREGPDLNGTIRESHPELCFQYLSGNVHLLWPKRFYLGIRERLGILGRFLPCAEDLLEESLAAIGPRNGAADDVLDAAALAVHAWLGCSWGVVSLPEPAEVDAQGLPMAMLFARLQCPSHFPAPGPNEGPPA